MDQVLRSPELLTLIFDMIRQDNWKLPVRPQASLAPLARVNSMWRDIVHPILWASPDAQGLAGIKSKRRQQYASHIRALGFSGRETRTDPTLHTLFASLQFSKIKKLVLGHEESLYFRDPETFRPLAIHRDWSISTSQYFRETLEDLELLSWDSICTRDSFMQIAERCPRLKRVHFSAIGTQLQPDDLLGFFRASDRLEYIDLHLGSESKSALITGDLLLHLSRMTKLKYLRIDNELCQPDFFWAIKKRNINPFQNLKTVLLTAISTVVSAAVHVLPNVESLCLFIPDGSCFKDLSTMSSLRELSIYVTTPTTRITPRQLLVLRTCHRLESLDMSTGFGEFDDPEASGLRNVDLDPMASGWPGLKKLDLNLMWRTRSVQTLASLSKYCPNLELLSLIGMYYIQALSDISAVMFPKLRRLHLEQSNVDDEPARLTPSQIARLIDYHAPVLENLKFMSEDDEVGDEAAELIEKAWNKLRA